MRVAIIFIMLSMPAFAFCQEAPIPELARWNDCVREEAQNFARTPGQEAQKVSKVMAVCLEFDHQFQEATIGRRPSGKDFTSNVRASVRSIAAMTLREAEKAR